jgi:hypothetical protein
MCTQDYVLGYFQPDLSKLANKSAWGQVIRCLYGSAVGLTRIGLTFDDHQSAFACGPGSPRTDVLGHSQPSLAGLFLAFMYTQDYVLGYSQPSLRD